MQPRLSRSQFVHGLLAGSALLFSSEAAAAASEIRTHRGPAPLSGRGTIPSPGLSASLQTPDAAAIQCLKQDDTQCAVAVWERQFALNPANDQTRQALYQALLIHSLRNLDKGNLDIARAAFERAKQVIPTSGSRIAQYLEEAFRAFSELHYAISMESNMDSMVFPVMSDAGFESRYVEIAGFLGNQTRAFALTGKVPDQVSFYNFASGSQSSTADIALRFLAFPMSANGVVFALFGYQDNDHAYIAEIGWQDEDSALTWVNHHTSTGWDTIGAIASLMIQPNQWHALEVRLRGQSVEFWVDWALIGHQVIPDYIPGEVGFGVGLNAGQAGRTFSAAFDDLTVYSLAS